ncbi:hypothetical protein Q669_23915 [Labrenzia sp. C1B10]|nr:hypothetical protein Q669_23915 [Labrenzia sp. C1B10]ERS02037.1 hypothetical protein Q675_08030 [Labrenzia sp. C1B70]
MSKPYRFDLWIGPFRLSGPAILYFLNLHCVPKIGVFQTSSR